VSAPVSAWSTVVALNRAAPAMMAAGASPRLSSSASIPIETTTVTASDGTIMATEPSRRDGRFTGFLPGARSRPRPAASSARASTPRSPRSTQLDEGGNR
jgi:hypothetical protein